MSAPSRRAVLALPVVALAACAPSGEAPVAAAASSPVLVGALGAPIAPLSGGSTAPEPAGIPGDPLRMSATDIAAALANNTARGVTTNGQPYTMYFASDGQERFREGGFGDSGTWRVLPDGRFCSALSRVSNRHPECYLMYRSGSAIIFQRPDGVIVGSFTIVPGNPEDL
jgi:hypothetical protein